MGLACGRTMFDNGCAEAGDVLRGLSDRVVLSSFDAILMSGFGGMGSFLGRLLLS